MCTVSRLTTTRCAGPTWVSPPASASRATAGRTTGSSAKVRNNYLGLRIVEPPGAKLCRLEPTIWSTKTTRFVQADLNFFVLNMSMCL